MKYSVFRDRLNALIPTILTLANETDKNLQTCLIIYTLKGSSLSDEQILDLITSLPIDYKEEIMDTLEIFEEKGRKKGIEEGKLEHTREAVKSLLKQALLTDEQIASAMNVTIDYVLEIRKRL